MTRWRSQHFFRLLKHRVLLRINGSVSCLEDSWVRVACLNYDMYGLVLRHCVPFLCDLSVLWLYGKFVKRRGIGFCRESICVLLLYVLSALPYSSTLCRAANFWFSSSLVCFWTARQCYIQRVEGAFRVRRACLLSLLSPRVLGRGGVPRGV